ncbi:MAG: transcription termination factor Rho [Tissierellia bacterium]|nr:transcription termination factor Rho [Tissierellia bacterium]
MSNREGKPLEVLSKKSYKDLTQIAKSLGLNIKSNMNKSELIDLISTKNLNSDITGAKEGEFENKDLNKMTITELREVAEKLEIRSPYKYKKSELRGLIDEVIGRSIELEHKPVSELRKIADSHGIPDSYKYNKNELLRLIKYNSEHTIEDTDIEEIEIEIEQEPEIQPEFNGIDLEDVSDNVSNIIEKMDDINYVSGILEVLQDGYGFLRRNNYLTSEGDVYVSPSQIRKFRLRTGDKVVGVIKPPSVTEKFNALIYINSVNDRDPQASSNREPFENLTPIYPDSRITLETKEEILATRMVDLIAPIGKGQRGLIVSQPKSGKTTLLKMVAKAIELKYPDTHLIVLLIDERPEEVTDMQRSVNGEVVYSTFDEQPKNHIKVAEMVIERAKRLVENKENVVILLDSITKLARAYNLVTPPSGKTLSGGLDPLSLYKPKKFFGSARNVEEGGSLTILATALVETGSRMDDIIYEEFKGTGNMEIHLDRKLSERRIFPAIDIYKSGTRKEELLLDKNELEVATLVRQAMGELSTQEVSEMLIGLLEETDNNKEFIRLINNRGLNRF